jgi:hypothetical protein
MPLINVELFKLQLLGKQSNAHDYATNWHMTLIVKPPSVTIEKIYINCLTV